MAALTFSKLIEHKQVLLEAKKERGKKLFEMIDKHLQERMPDLLKEVEREIQKELEVHEWQVVKP